MTDRRLTICKTRGRGDKCTHNALPLLPVIAFRTRSPVRIPSSDRGSQDARGRGYWFPERRTEKGEDAVPTASLARVPGPPVGRGGGWGTSAPTPARGFPRGMGGRAPWQGRPRHGTGDRDCGGADKKPTAHQRNVTANAQRLGATFISFPLKSIKGQYCSELTYGFQGDALRVCYVFHWFPSVHPACTEHLTCWA